MRDAILKAYATYTKASVSMSVRKDSYAWLGVGVLVAVIISIAVFFILSIQEVATVRIGDGVFRARVASTEPQRARGLGGVKSLKRDDAMLFIFDSDEKHAIWMKDMNVPIDAVWLNADREVIHVEEAIQPDSYPDEFSPGRPARYILELPSGAVDRVRIENGMIMTVEGREL